MSTDAYFVILGSTQAGCLPSRRQITREQFAQLPATREAYDVFLHVDRDLGWAGCRDARTGGRFVTAATGGVPDRPADAAKMLPQHARTALAYVLADDWISAQEAFRRGNGGASVRLETAEAALRDARRLIDVERARRTYESTEVRPKSGVNPLLVRYCPGRAAVRLPGIEPIDLKVCFAWHEATVSSALPQEATPKAGSPRAPTAAVQTDARQPLETPFAEVLPEFIFADVHVRVHRMFVFAKDRSAVLSFEYACAPTARPFDLAVFVRSMTLDLQLRLRRTAPPDAHFRIRDQPVPFGSSIWKRVKQPSSEAEMAALKFGLPEGMDPAAAARDLEVVVYVKVVGGSATMGLHLPFEVLASR